jgi:mannose-6-phosphate isomerase-like protein (cupin superfamily)
VYLLKAPGDWRSRESRVVEEEEMAKVVGPNDGKMGFLGSIGVRFILGGHESGGGVALVEHPMSARALAAPLHKHALEDEYSFILTGRVGALLGDEVLEGGPGDLIFKPRNQWHTFWNAGDEPARILEVISPAGFEKFFEELSDMGGVAQAPPEKMMQLLGRYKLELDPDSVPGLVERFSVRFPGEPLKGGWSG